MKLLKNIYMKKAGVLLLLSLLLPVLLSISGCIDDSSDPKTVYGSGHLVSEMRPAANFTTIEMNGAISLILVPGDTLGVRIQSDDNIISLVETTVIDGKLSITSPKGSYSGITVNAYVCCKSLQKIIGNGTAAITTPDPLNFTSISIEGAGATSVTLKGKTQKQELVLSGASHVDNSALECNETSVILNGAGNVVVQSLVKLNAVISGMGVIEYIGDPTDIKQTINGSGSIVKRAR